MPRRARTAAVAFALMLAAASPAPATLVSIRREMPAELARGQAEGVAVSERGWLFLSPRIAPLGRSASPGRPAYVWAATADGSGNLYLGTGPDGQILRITPTGEQTVWFAVEEPMVTALAVTPEGDVLAGATPGGRIYRVRPDGRGEVWSETGTRYVWSLALDGAGNVFAGTGESGAILKINRSGAAGLFFDSDESHIVSLVTLADGGLLAGGSGRGLVYRLDVEGHAYVVHDDDLEEVTAMVAEPGGGLTAAFIASSEPEPKRPELALRLPDGVTIGAPHESMATLEESSGPLLRATVEGLPGDGQRVEDTLRGRLVRIDEDGRVTELWKSTTEAPYALVRDGSGRLLLGTGEPARLYRVEPGGDVSLLRTLREAQLTELYRLGRETVLATSNPAATYRLEEAGGDAGVFLSHPFDAGGPARWGSLRWRVEQASGRSEFYTRTGNSSFPDGTWSAWGPVLMDPAGSHIDNPDGRYMQYRVRLSGDQAGGPRVSGITARFEPYNRPPELREFRPEARGGGEVAAFRWSARDTDGDEVEIGLDFRVRGTDVWQVATATADKTEGADSDGFRAGRILWDTTGVAEGEYELRAVASDQASNHPGEGGRAVVEHPEIWVVDRTPPEIEIRVSPGGELAARLSDRLSDVQRLEVLENGRPRFSPRPEDGICDSRIEQFRFELPAGADVKSWTVRGMDAAGNRVERSLARP